jgi:alcohol dehydrogenase
MRALVFAGKGQPVLEERPRPQILAPTDTVVKMVKGTICGKSSCLFCVCNLK